jgi:hypothetical protein
MQFAAVMIVRWSSGNRISNDEKPERNPPL